MKQTVARGSLWLLAAHIAVLIFGLIGIVIMLPNPQLWASDPRAVRVFDFSIQYAGSIQILLGATAIALYGWHALGWRFTACFFAVTYALSLTSELIGTATGWPFGDYAYTEFLGFKILGRVPYTIPFSWFAMGLASYLLGSQLAQRLRVRRHSLWSLLLGAWLLTAWDLVLDPAMAHTELSIQFWRWGQEGAYFGMPLQNLLGWSLTGLAFMAVHRAVWRRDPVLAGATLAVPLIFYGANMAFAMVVSASVGLWVPIVLAAGSGVLPAMLAAAGSRRTPAPQLRLVHDA
ncbi:MAG: carotenoid biosynthesis protein [Chloroflexota bacterium]